jgi:hypothetical protein
VAFLSAEPDPAALQAPPAITAPADAIVVAPGGGAHAWLFFEGRVRRVAVVPGERRGERVVVRSGLTGTESLVLSPPADLEDGQAVNVETNDDRRDE